MRVPLALAFPATIAAIAIAACGGPQPAPYVNPPAYSSPAPAGALALTQTGQLQSGGTASGYTGVLSWIGGSGTVIVTSSSTPQAATAALVPTGTTTSPNVYYLTLSSAGGATINALPAVELTLATAAVATVQEAQWSGTAWVNVSGATGAPNTASTAVSFPPGTTSIKIAAGGSIYLGFYQGTGP